MVKIVTYELKSKWDRLVLYWYFPLQCLVSFSKMLGRSVNNFVGIPLNGLFFLLSANQIVKVASSHPKNQGDKFVLIFLFYSLITVLWTLLGGFPIDCYIESIKLFILPMLFYFWGRNAENISNKFYKVFVWTCFVVMVVGLYLYFTMPSFYSAFLIESYRDSWMKQGSVTSDMVIIDRHRFSSFLSSSYSVCFFSVSSLALILSSNLSGSKVSLIGKNRYSTLIFYAMVIIFLTSAILCSQRTAMVCSVAIVLFYILYGSTKKKMSFFIIAIVLIGMLGLFLTPSFHNERSSIVQENVFERVEGLDFDDAMNERSNQYVFVLNNVEKYVIGTGLGSAGTRAAERGFRGITDGEFIHMFAELGLFGCVCFFLLMLYTLKRGIKYFRYFNGEIMIILFFLVSCIGANALSMNHWTGLFWYSVGRIWNNNYCILGNRVEKL